MLAKRWTPKGLRKVRKSLMGHRRTPDDGSMKSKVSRFDRNWLGLHSNRSTPGRDDSVDGSFPKSVDDDSMGPTEETDEDSRRTTSDQGHRNMDLNNEVETVTSGESYPGLGGDGWVDLRNKGIVASGVPLPDNSISEEDHVEEEETRQQPPGQEKIVSTVAASSTPSQDNNAHPRAPASPFRVVGGDSPPKQWPTPERRGLVSELSAAVEHLERDNKLLRKQVKRLVRALGEQHAQVIEPLEKSLAEMTAERDELTRDLERETSEQEVRRMYGEALQQALAEVTAERDVLRRELEGVSGEQEGSSMNGEKRDEPLEQALAEVTTERELERVKPEQEGTKLDEERDQPHSGHVSDGSEESCVIESESAELLEALAQLTAERDELQQELDLVAAEPLPAAESVVQESIDSERDELIDFLQDSLDRMTAERNELQRNLDLATADQDIPSETVEDELEGSHLDSDSAEVIEFLRASLAQVTAERDELRQEVELLTEEQEDSVLDETDEAESYLVGCDSFESAEMEEGSEGFPDSNDTSLYYEVEAMMAEADDLIESILQEETSPKEASEHVVHDCSEPSSNETVDIDNVKSPNSMDESPMDMVKKLCGLLESDTDDERQQLKVLFSLDALALFLKDEESQPADNEAGAGDTQRDLVDDDSLDGYLSTHSEFEEEPDSCCLYELRAELERVGQALGRPRDLPTHVTSPSQQNNEFLKESPWSLFHEDFSSGFAGSPQGPIVHDDLSDDWLDESVASRELLPNPFDSGSNATPSCIVFSTNADSIQLTGTPSMDSQELQMQSDLIESRGGPRDTPRELRNLCVLTPSKFENAPDVEEVEQDASSPHQSQDRHDTPSWRRHLDFSFQHTPEPALSCGLSCLEVSELHFWLLHYQRKCAMFEQERDQVVEAALELFETTQRAKDAEMATLKNQVVLLQMDFDAMAGAKADPATDDCTTSTEGTAERDGAYARIVGADEIEHQPIPVDMGGMRLVTV